MVESDPRSGSPRLLVLGAGPAQLGLLEAARGARTLARRRRPRPVGARASRSPTAAASSRPRTSPRSSGSSARSAIDGIIAPGTDWPVGVAARIAERAGLPHPISPRRPCWRRTSSGSASGSTRPACRSRGGTSSARDDATPELDVPVRRQGARPPGPAGARRSSTGVRARARARRRRARESRGNARARRGARRRARR